jgi:serine/threonine-protein kinase
MVLDFVSTGVDGKPLLKVLDFGISKLISPTGGSVDHALTSTTDVMGSPSYMAPEQLRAARDADERADIWSLGVILYEVITGCLPWNAESVTELGAMVLRDEPRPMRVLREGVPPGLEEIVIRCLEKDRSKRYPSVVELASALEPHALGLAVGSAERITSVARTSRRPPGARTSLADRPSSSSSRVLVSGGTSVSWGETELQQPMPSIPPRLRSRSGLLVLASVLAAVVAVAAGYTLTKRTGASVAASPPVLPEDRGAIRPPATASTAMATQAPVAPPPPPSSVSLHVAEPIPAPPPLASIPRRAPPPSTPPPAVQAPAPEKTGASVAKPPDAHDMGTIPRK